MLGSGFLKRFKLKDVTKISCYEDIVKYLYQPKDPSSLGVIRCLFGLLMIVDLAGERGGGDIDIRWGNSKNCHFPLFPFLKPLTFPYMSLLYGIMFLGAVGIMLGLKFRLSTFLFGVPYWYILLLDKSFWNNHSYLYGIVTILLMGSSANHFLSLDGWFNSSIRNTHVPYWNYFILKFQFFMLYFLAGLKKTDTEWLEGYSMVNLGKHWVFSPFQILLSSEQIDYLVVHWFGFLLDLTIGFWMLVELTKPLALVFCASFHLMNSRLFNIGMFPYVCLATLPLFCAENWPRKIKALFLETDFKSYFSSDCIYNLKEATKYKVNKSKLPRKVLWKHKFIVALLMFHCGLQAFLPYSHFITKGYNNWTNGLYGYSWDMMIHSWNTILVVVKVVDNNTGRENFVNNDAWTYNDKWNKHADMCLQYAYCLKDNLLSDLKSGTDSHTSDPTTPSNYITSENISIYIDVWCSLNNRFQQRMFNPNYDLLKAEWSPFKEVEWLLPLLSEYNHFRRKMDEITKEVYSWSNNSDVLFVADFPGLSLENYINTEMSNVSLTILEGEVVYEIKAEFSEESMGVKLTKGDRIPIEIGSFHKIHTVGSNPSCYMYTYTKHVEIEASNENLDNAACPMYSPFPLIEDVQHRIHSFSKMFSYISQSLWRIFTNLLIKI